MSSEINLTNNLAEFTKELKESIFTNLPDFSQMGQMELPIKYHKEIIFNPLEQLAEKADKIFKNLNDEVVNSPQFMKYMAEGFLEIITHIAEKVDQLPPNLIAECGVNEAVFTHALDSKPIVATESLATCIGVIGYQSENRSGFAIHFASEDALETSQEMLLEKIKGLAKGHPIDIHLRGGIKDMSETLVTAIETWIESGSKKGCPMTIMSRDILTKGLLNESGVPNAMSIRLDTRDGTLSGYDSSTNPFTKKREISDVDDLFSKVIQSFIKKAEIEVVYFPKI